MFRVDIILVLLMLVSSAALAGSRGGHL